MNGRCSYGPIQTLFLRNLKSLNWRIWTRPSESTSKMVQKPKIWGLVTFKKCSKFWVQSFETLTHNCEKTVVRIKILTSASERGPRDLLLMVLWRYTDMVMIWVFMIPLNLWNWRFFKIRNHKSSFNSFHIMSKLKITSLYKNCFKTIYGSWFRKNADFINLVESWKPIS